MAAMRWIETAAKQSGGDALIRQSVIAFMAVLARCREPAICM